MNPAKREPVALAATLVAIVMVICAFTSWTTEQDLAVQGLALALGAYFARRNVTPIE